MGADFSYHKVFIDKEIDSEKVADEITNIFLAQDWEPCSEKDADRSICISNPSNNWVHIGDSAGSTEYEAADNDFETLSIMISNTFPVIDLIFSDSAALHMYLYINNKRIDQYGNLKLPFFKFNCDEVSYFHGNADLWKPFLLKRHTANELRKVWDQISSSKFSMLESMLNSISALFGWDESLNEIGYTHDDEGCGIKYTDYISRNNITNKGF